MPKLDLCTAVLSALWIGVLIHVDWHLGRPGPDHLSFALPYHWLLGVVAFAPLPWLPIRRPLLVIGLGVALGQGLEPLGEVIFYQVGAEPFTNPTRWRIFAEFLTAGLLAYVASGALAVTRAKRSVTPALRRSEPRRVAGLAVRTTNAAEGDPSLGKLPELWGQFMSEGWFERLGQAGALGPTIAVYSGYESDASGSYQVLVGREVGTSSPAAPPFEVVSVPGARYLVFPAPGPLPQAIIDGWRNIWEYFARDTTLVRAYTFDFERYPDGASAEIWVAVEDQ